MFLRATFIAAAVAAAALGPASPANSAPGCQGASGICAPAAPAPAPAPPPPPPRGAKALCKDGRFSFVKDPHMACQFHGGIVQRF